ncbi:MAG TPA: hypothetical protein PLF42_02040 [Anaerolineales bacterium]|nr:hypothetical protein [Anaerolineales bacterium]
MNTERTLTSYLIRLRGKLDPELASWFPELSLTEEADGNTMLVGELPDQSALLGILFRIHNLNLQILSVQIQKFQTTETQ